MFIREHLRAVFDLLLEDTESKNQRQEKAAKEQTSRKTRETETKFQSGEEGEVSSGAPAQRLHKRLVSLGMRKAAPEYELSRAGRVRNLKVKLKHTKSDPEAGKARLQAKMAEFKEKQAAKEEAKKRKLAAVQQGMEQAVEKKGRKAAGRKGMTDPKIRKRNTEFLKSHGLVDKEGRPLGTEIPTRRGNVLAALRRASERQGSKTEEVEAAEAAELVSYAKHFAQSARRAADKAIGAFSKYIQESLSYTRRTALRNERPELFEAVSSGVLRSEKLRDKIDQKVTPAFLKSHGYDPETGLSADDAAKHQKNVKELASRVKASQAKKSKHKVLANANKIISKAVGDGGATRSEKIGMAGMTARMAERGHKLSDKDALGLHRLQLKMDPKYRLQHQDPQTKPETDKPKPVLRKTKVEKLKASGKPTKGLSRLLGRLGEASEDGPGEGKLRKKGASEKHEVPENEAQQLVRKHDKINGHIVKISRVLKNLHPEDHVARKVYEIHAVAHLHNLHRNMSALHDGGVATHHKLKDLQAEHPQEAMRKGDHTWFHSYADSIEKPKTKKEPEASVKKGRGRPKKEPESVATSAARQQVKLASDPKARYEPQTPVEKKEQARLAQSKLYKKASKARVAELEKTTQALRAKHGGVAPMSGSEWKRHLAKKAKESRV